MNAKEKKIADVDTQVSLAIGERDAVQLEARAQVEDFEEKIKVMQQQLLQVESAVILLFCCFVVLLFCCFVVLLFEYCILPSGQLKLAAHNTLFLSEDHYLCVIL